MYQNEEQSEISKKRFRIIVTLIFILVISSIVLVILILQQRNAGQQKQSAQTKQETQNSLQVENKTTGGNAGEAAPVNVSTLSFDSQTEAVKTNEELSMTAVLDPKGKKITVADLYIVFDPKALKLESITPSDVFSLVLSNEKIDNAKGTASISLGIPMENPGVGDISKIATFKFKTLSFSGNTEVKFSDSTIIGAEGQKTNALNSSSPVTITLQK